MALPAVSVIIPAYRAERTLERCLAATLSQEGVDDYEVILVVSADVRADLPALRPLAHAERLRVVEHVPRLGAAAARNAGAASAVGQWLVFTDADAVPAKDWLRNLVAAAADGACVAGAVLNGTPDSADGTGEYLLAFLDLAPRRPRRRVWHGATCNLLVPRHLWLRYGPFPEDMLGGEDTMLTARFSGAGLLRFSPDATITHLNRTTRKAVVANQHLYGRFTADLVRRGVSYPLAPLVRRPLLAPLAGGARFVWLCTRAPRRVPLPLHRLLASLPVALAGVVAWTAGVMSEGRRLDRAARRR